MIGNNVYQSIQIKIINSLFLKCSKISVELYKNAKNCLKYYGKLILKS